MLTLLAAVLAATVTSSTKCGTTDVTFGTLPELRLIGCGEGFSDNKLWHLDLADSSPGVLNQTTTRTLTGKGAVIYIVDSGVMRDHDEFARAEGSNVIGAITGAGTTSTPCPNGKDRALYPCPQSEVELIIYGHGTAVASMAAGKTTGVAPDAKIVSVYIQSNSAEAWAQTLDRIIAHAYDPQTPQFKTGIVNMSFVPGYASAGDPDNARLEQKIRDMIDGVNAWGLPDPAGKRFVFTIIGGNYTTDAGNQCDSQMRTNLYPSVLGRSIDGLITVGGLDHFNHQWLRACRARSVDILAPAEDLLVASPSGADRYRSGQPVNNSYPLNSGTSYAAPFVAGIAALWLEQDPDMTPVEIEYAIKKHSSFDQFWSERVAVFPGVASEPMKFLNAPKIPPSP